MAASEEVGDEDNVAGTVFGLFPARTQAVLSVSAIGAAWLRPSSVAASTASAMLVESTAAVEGRVVVLCGRRLLPEVFRSSDVNPR
mgnify:CR=1 FL=1